MSRKATDAMNISRPLPRLRGEEQIYFDEAKAGRLAYQRCADCATSVFYPRSVCPECLSENLTLRTSSGRGVVYSYTTLQVPGNPAFADVVPYTIVLVDLEEGVRVVADLVEVEPDEVAVGQPVEVFFESVSDDFTVPRFRAIGDGRDAR